MKIPALTEVLKELPLLKVLKLPVKKEKENYIINKLKSLTNFNNVKIVREEKKKEKVFNYVNKITIEKLFRETKEKILKIEEFEEKYL